MVKFLSEYFSLNRRYARSVNLERDFDSLEAVQGYILTDRSLYALKRILVDPTDANITRAKTITSVYGTGKSAFADFLSSLCAPASNPVRELALEIVQKSLEPSDYETLIANLPEKGFFRAIATAQREPLTHTIIRALDFGADRFWSKKRNKIDLAKRLSDLSLEIESGKAVTNIDILAILKEVLQKAEAPVILLIDELGKTLEFASMHQRTEDLYLLQQIAELKPNKGQTFYLVGMLHQSFADYGDRLATVQRNEWSKIQGRFEDIAFSNQPRQMARLIGQAIQNSLPDKLAKRLRAEAKDWCKQLTAIGISDISPDLLAATYPLHPITALVLPVLCTNYAQNDRSLFTFLTSSEPFSLKQYLDETEFDGGQVPLLKLDRIYDYFIEAIGAGFGSRPQLHKWVEIHNQISNSRSLKPEEQAFLKTIGILNLIDSTGELRASLDLVKLALCDRPLDAEKKQSIEVLIEHFSKNKGILIYRKQVDELRIWEGTDFNIEAELNGSIEQDRTDLVTMLASTFTLKPIIAQRHSYQTGTVRYFERRYLDSTVDWSKLNCANNSYDGLIGYWVDAQAPQKIPERTADNKPLVVLTAGNLNLLEIMAAEYSALKKLQMRPELGNDVVARQEVRYRLGKAEQLLDAQLTASFDLSKSESSCWMIGKQKSIDHIQDFNAKLSDVCDLVYDRSLKVWNELINRRELTSQAVKAMRLLIEAMLDRSDLERLGLQGYGPETSIYESMLRETGIHRIEDGILGFYPPQTENVLAVWVAMENFCTGKSSGAIEKPETFDRLYQQLEAPPYGVKRGAIPILLAALLLYHNDDISIYKDGTFIPLLGAEHFELLVKHPQRFSVKYFEIVGLRSKVFRELETILKSPNPKKVSAKVRNVTMLSVVKPLFQFVKNLATYTTKTHRISPEAQAVVQALLKAQEPDRLLFTSLPVACGMEPIGAGNGDDNNSDNITAKLFKSKLVRVLHEIQTAYDRLLADCQNLLHDAFGIRSGEDKLREDLRVRASCLTGNCSERMLKSFVMAAADETVSDRQWLESLLMIVADKPAESWTDADMNSFELKLSDLSRRFINLEALVKGIESSLDRVINRSFDARRITITHPDGHEVHRLVWLDREDSDRLEVLVDKILDGLMIEDEDRLQQALIAKLAERVLNKESV